MEAPLQDLLCIQDVRPLCSSKTTLWIIIIYTVIPLNIILTCVKFDFMPLFKSNILFVEHHQSNFTSFSNIAYTRWLRPRLGQDQHHFVIDISIVPHIYIYHPSTSSILPLVIYTSCKVFVIVQYDGKHLWTNVNNTCKNITHWAIVYT